MLSERKRAAILANLKKAGPLTPDGRQRLRAACRRNQPWRHSTGPRTPAGKARSRMNAYQFGDCDVNARAMNLYISDLGAFGRAYALSLEAIMDADAERLALADEGMHRTWIRLAHCPPKGDAAHWIEEHRLLLAQFPRTVTGKRSIPANRRSARPF